MQTGNSSPIAGSRRGRRINILIAQGATISKIGIRGVRLLHGGKSEKGASSLTAAAFSISPKRPALIETHSPVVMAMPDRSERFEGVELKRQMRDGRRDTTV
jgi:hypothetical protein